MDLNVCKMFFLSRVRIMYEGWIGSFVVEKIEKRLCMYNEDMQVWLKTTTKVLYTKMNFLDYFMGWSGERLKKMMTLKFWHEMMKEMEDFEEGEIEDEIQTLDTIFNGKRRRIGWGWC